MNKFLENIKPIKSQLGRNGNPELLYNYNVLNQFCKILSQWQHRPVGFTDELSFLSFSSQNDELRTSKRFKGQ